MNTLLHDLRYALRMLAKSPGVAAAAIVTLALTIGVNTAMFSLVNRVVLAPLPFEDADRLVRFFRQSRDGSETHAVSYPDYLDYRDRSDVFDNLAVYSFIPANVDHGQGGETRFGQVVSGNYFAMLGVEALYGRVLTPEDNVAPGGHPVLVVSHRYWQRAFGGRPDVVGRTIMLGNHAFTIVGVAPRGFAGAIPVSAPDFWAPLMMIGQIRPDDRELLDQRDSEFLFAMGKLKHGVTIEQARAALAVTAAQLKEVDPDRYNDEAVALFPALGAFPMTEGTRRVALAIAALIMSMVGLVLIVGCANLANLLLARATARGREIGIRLAIGASRSRIVRQMLVESMLLAVLGGAGGLLLALWAMDVLVASLPRLPFDVSIDLDFGVDWRVLAFTAAVSMLSGLLFGLFPALGATRLDLSAALKDDAAVGRLHVRRARMRSALVVAQVTASLVLLIVAGLFGRSLVRARALDPGFDHENVLAVMLDFGTQDYDAAAGADYCERLLERVRSLPGVESASIETCPPLTIAFTSTEFWIEDRTCSSPDDERVEVAFSIVSEDNFRTLGMPLLRGRDFDERDTPDSPGVAVVNQAFVQRYWPGHNPLGKRISARGAEGPFLKVVGVVRTAKYWQIGEQPRPYVYRALSQRPVTSFASLLLRTAGDPLTLAAPVRAAMRELDPNMVPADVRTMTDTIGVMLLPARFAAVGFGLFGTLALLLASVGLYGVMSCAVNQRVREIGIRTALGAQRSDILRLIMKQGLVLTTVGLVLGLLICACGTRVLSSLLYEIGTTDPVTFVGVCLLLAGVALLACYLPARRATRIDPLVALRCE